MELIATMPTSLFRPVTTQNAFEAVVEQIAGAIDLGLLISGDRLPAERELPGLLGVSRSTVREALRVLVMSGYVAIRRGAAGGAFVLERQRGGHDDRVRAALRVRRRELIDHFEWRRLIEAEGTALAALRVGDDQLRALRARLVEQGQRGRSAERWRADDSRFHIAVAEASGNPYLAEAVRAARVKLASVLDALMVDQSWARGASSGHREILAALQARDPVAARSAALRHGEEAEEHLRRFLGAEEQAGPL